MRSVRPSSATFFARQHAAHRGDGLPYTREWALERGAVPVLHDGMARRPEPEDEATGSELRDRTGCGGDGGRRANVDRRHRQADAHALGHLRHRAGQDERIGATRLGDPDALVTQVFRPPRPVETGRDVAGNGQAEGKLSEVHTLECGFGVRWPFDQLRTAALQITVSPGFLHSLAL